MSKKTYSNLLKDPRWQRKRLEILERDNFTCLECESKDKTLHVHHCWYENGMMPWEYPQKCYRTVCLDCHETRQNFEKTVEKALAGFSTSDLEDMLWRFCITAEKFGMGRVCDWIATCEIQAEDGTE